MTKLQDIQSFYRRHRIVSMIVGQVVVLGVLAVFVLNSVFGVHLFSAFAQVSCSSGDTVYTISAGDTLNNIAAAHGTSLQTLAQHNQIGDPNVISVNQQICIPGNGNGSTPSQPQGAPLHNTVNPFPYGTCPWWAALRYAQVHSLFVPWKMNADAWQWTARAYEFHWRVSNQPSVGAIVDFQPGIQYASSVGHVGVVEQILGNGNVVVSNMSVLGHPFGSVVNLTYHTGPGVTFITA